MQELKDAMLNSYDAILHSVCILYVDAVAGILNIIAECDAMNRGTSTLPPVLPKNVLNFSRAQFGDLIVAQKLRLLESFTEHELIDLEMEFKSFLSQANQEQKFREIIESTNDYISFDEAWSMIRG